jgi:hypothetical protein
MADDLRALGRVSLASGSVMTVAGAGMVVSGELPWPVIAQVVVRCFFAGAVIPPILSYLGGRHAPAARWSLALAAAGLAAIAALTFPYLLHVLLLPIATVAALASTRFHRHGVVLMFAGVAVSVLLWLIHWAGGLYVPPYWLGGLWGLLGAGGFGVLILAWALRRPKSWRRWRIAAPVLLLGFGAFCLPVEPMDDFANARFLRRADLNAFADRARRYGPITGMWEGEDRPFQVNGTRVAHTRAGADSVARWYAGDVGVLADVLARDGIDPAVYEDFRRQMKRFHFWRLETEDGYVRLAQTRGCGLVQAPPDAPILRPGGRVPGGGVVVERRGRWYTCRYEPQPAPTPPIPSS